MKFQQRFDTGTDLMSKIGIMEPTQGFDGTASSVPSQNSKTSINTYK